ncbi:MAG TPA: hypothetical protein VHM90_02470 [Phycisphaerae bacterium]|nr:hypothetical protein [Phycisphaerae bacterium]
MKCVAIGKRAIRPLALAAVFVALGAVAGAPPQVTAPPFPARGAAAMPSSSTAAEGANAEAPASRSPPTRGGPGGRGSPSGMPVAPATRPLVVLTDGPTCSFDATVYEIHVAADQIGKINADNLKGALGTAAEFEQALAKVGTSRPAYRTFQKIRLGSESYVQIGANMPYVTNSQVTNTGQTINSVGYTSVGAIFDVIGKLGDNGMINLQLSVQVSAMDTSSGVQIAPGVNAPLARRAILQQDDQVQPEKPFMTMTADGGAPDKDGNAVVYVARMTLGKPQGNTGNMPSTSPSATSTLDSNGNVVGISVFNPALEYKPAPPR